MNFQWLTGRTNIHVYIISNKTLFILAGFVDTHSNCKPYARTKKPLISYIYGCHESATTTINSTTMTYQRPTRHISRNSIKNPNFNAFLKSHHTKFTIKYNRIFIQRLLLLLLPEDSGTSTFWNIRL